MAQKRMFTMKICDSDAFLDMPLSTQCLYFHLNMRADDDGFIGNPKRIQQLVGASSDDLKLLIAKRFVLAFDNGVIVIKHWKMHNYIAKDRYEPTSYIEEKNMLSVKDNKAYTLDKMNTKCIQNVNTDLDIDKESDKDIKKSSHFVPPSLQEVQTYCKERNNSINAEQFIDHYTANGWIQGKGKPIKDWKAAVRTWERNGFNRTGPQQPKQNKFNAHPQRAYTEQEYAELEKQLLRR
jgi:hypothetical protein